MFKHQLFLSFRFLLKHRSYALTNIFGLSIGLAGTLMILLFLQRENSFDQFHEHGDDIYRLNSSFTLESGDASHYINSAPALVPGIRGQFPEVQALTRMRYAQRLSLTHQDQTFYEDYGFYADSVFLDIFSFEMSLGDAETALDEPNSIVLDENLALKYFGRTDVLGERLSLNRETELKVTGVLKPVPENSHLQFNFLLSFSTYQVPEGYASDLTSWGWLGFLAYAQLVPEADHKAFEGKLNQLYADIMEGSSVAFEVEAKPLSDIYLRSGDRKDDLNSHMASGNPLMNQILLLVAILILAIAGFNFVNLTIALSLGRAREIGIKKVLGARVSGITLQILMESVIVVSIGLLLALFWAWLATPLLENYLNWQLNLEWQTVAPQLLKAIGLLLTFALLIGLYPALLMARFNILGALKNQLKRGKGAGSHIRIGLVLAQFCISAGLITATLVIGNQLEYLRNRSLGFDKENVVSIELQPQDMAQHYERLKSVLSQNAGVLSVSRSERLIGEPWPTNTLQVIGDELVESKRVTNNLVDVDFLQTMGIKLVAGRDFEKGRSLDSLNAIIINQTAVEHLGLDDPIGQQVEFFSSNGPRTIIGVVEDFNFSTLHENIGPMVFIRPFIDVEYVHIRLAKGELLDRLETIRSEWEATAPGVPLDFRFLDQHLESLYQKEMALLYLINGFSALAVVLAMLGLFSLVSYMIRQRQREVGLRKVLGASVTSILLLLSKKYLSWVMIASIISLPIVQLMLVSWRQQFAYKAPLQAWPFVLSGLLLGVLALLIINLRALKAARANPTEMLRTE